MWELVKLRERLTRIGCARLIAGVVCATTLWMDTQAMAAPDAAMMAGPETIARFIETREPSGLSAAFAESDVTIIENFAPHLFTGPDAVRFWTGSMRAHLDGVTELRHTFGPAQDFTRTGDLVFFSLPTRWTGVVRGTRFAEQGGWAFVLVRRGAQWRVRSYGWAVVDASRG